MKEMFKKFLKKHFERLFFLGVASLLSIVFILIGFWKEEMLGALVTSGVTTLNFVLGILLNKARSPENNTDTEDVISSDPALQKELLEFLKKEKEKQTSI